MNGLIDTVLSLFSGSRSADTRTLVDIISQSTALTLSTSPSTKVELGDYGSVDPKTGSFSRVGNLRDRFPDILRWVGEPETTHEELMVVKASQIKNSKQDGEGNGPPAPAQTENIRDGLEFQYNAARHAVLYLIKPALSQYPNSGLLGDYLQWKLEGNPQAKKLFSRMAIVTKTYRSLSYAQLLTNGHQGRASCKFLPGAVAPEVDREIPALGNDQVWEVKSDIGAWSTGSYEPGKYQYTPLVQLHSLKKLYKCDFVQQFQFHCDSPAEFISVYHRVPSDINVITPFKGGINDGTKEEATVVNERLPAPAPSHPEIPITSSRSPVSEEHPPSVPSAYPGQTTPIALSPLKARALFDALNTVANPVSDQEQGATSNRPLPTAPLTPPPGYVRSFAAEQASVMQQSPPPALSMPGEKENRTTACPPDV